MEGTVEERVKKVVSSILKVDVSKMKNESEFVKDLGAESIQSIELVASFECEFDIEMEEEASLQVKNIGDAIKFIEKAIKEQKG
ncbi:MAG: acyl carrier protein [Candidatus Firestonebacteria bacterium]